MSVLTATRVCLTCRDASAVLCREEAQNLWAKKPDFDKLGVRLVAVFKEWLQAEIDEFSAKFWHNEELYLDEEKVKTEVSICGCRNSDRG